MAIKIAGKNRPPKVTGHPPGKRKERLEKAVKKIGPKKTGDDGFAGKSPVTIRLDKSVLDFFKTGGTGWQSRINQALRKIAGLDGG